MNRIQTTLSKGLMVCMAALLLLSTAAGTAWAAERYPDAANKAIAWMRTQQQPDGSFAGFGAGSTVDALLAIVASGQDPASFTQGSNTPLTFLQSKAGDLAKTPGGAGKLLIAVSAAGIDGTQFGGINLVDVLNKSYNAGTGQYGEDAIGHAFAILGLKAATQEVPENAATFLRGIQTPEGGWAFTGATGAGGADTNTTAVVVQALVAMGATGDDPVLQKARDYLLTQQGADGGFPYQKGGEFGSESDVNSTAYVAQALQAMGADNTRAAAFILSMQKPNGAFQWKPSEPDDNAGATYQAVPILLRNTLNAPEATSAPVELPAPSGAGQPGMPSTGEGNWTPITALAALSALAVGAGVLARRRAAA